MAEKLGKKSLKRVWEEREELQEQHEKVKQRYQEKNKELQTLMDDKENEISELKKQKEEMQTTIQKLESDSKADKKKIRMLVRNNQKKRKLLDSEEIKYWQDYLERPIEDDEDRERYEELEACLHSSDESADESDDN